MQRYANVTSLIAAVLHAYHESEFPSVILHFFYEYSMETRVALLLAAARAGLQENSYIAICSRFGYASGSEVRSTAFRTNAAADGAGFEVNQ